MSTVLLASNLLPLQTDSIWSNPESVLSFVKEHIDHLPAAKADDPLLRLGSWNMEYMFQAKAKHFLETYREVTGRHHLLAVQEVTTKGLSTIAQASSYNFCTSQGNSRGQAVGFLIHPRLQINKITEYTQLINAYGIPDLRPALRVDLFDHQTQLKLSVITLHLKSMRGGLRFTSLVRKRQLQQLMIASAENINPTIIAGDFNCFLDISDDIDCLVANGYQLINPHNHTSTQASGGRLDGLFLKNLPTGLKLGKYAVHNFWRSSLLGKSLSDHGLLTWQLK
jgi:hypothetical protein